MDKEFHPTPCNGCNYLSILWLTKNHVNKRGPWTLYHIRHWTVINYVKTNVDLLIQRMLYAVHFKSMMSVGNSTGRQQRYFGDVRYAIIYNAIVEDTYMIEVHLLKKQKTSYSPCSPANLSSLMKYLNIAGFFFFGGWGFMQGYFAGTNATMRLWP